MLVSPDPGTDFLNIYLFTERIIVATLALGS
jgi:hypothetical protein